MNITIGLVVPMIGYLYYGQAGGEVPTIPASVIKGGLPVYLACSHGRKEAMTN